jgi:hypothetical protein
LTTSSWQAVAVAAVFLVADMRVLVAVLVVFDLRLQR